MRAFIAIMLFTCWLQASAGDHVRRLPPNEAFSFLKAKKMADLSGRLTASEISEAHKLIEQHHCSTNDVGLFYKRGHKVRILTADCSGTYPSDSTLVEYPLTILVTAGSVQRVRNFEQFGFMYQSGDFRAVSDIDKNGFPEFWLGGSICECDGLDENDPCDCFGETVAEARKGVLAEWKPRNK